jgi:hypothetical protein
MVSIAFPVDGVNLNFVAAGEMGCFHCTDERFDSAWS